MNFRRNFRPIEMRLCTYETRLRGLRRGLARRLHMAERSAVSYVMHVVSHSHWDREWYLTFQQFRLRLLDLIDHHIAAWISGLSRVPALLSVRPFRPRGSEPE